MAFAPVKLWYELFPGYSAQQIESLQQGKRGVELVKAQDVISFPLGKIWTRPGFSKVRSSAISGTPSITGMFHLGDLADEFILWGSADGKPYRDNANPPGVLAGGTPFTTGANVLVRGDIFNDKLITCSNARDLPQTISAAAAWADLGGTPARGVDVKAFARRVCMFSPAYAGTTYRSFMSFTSANDDQTAWTAPVTINFLNFGRIGTDVNVLGGEFFIDHLMTFTEDAAFPVYATPNALLPLAFQDFAFSEDGGGPPNIHSVVKADNKLFWISKNSDVKVMLPDKSVHSIGFPIQPYLRTLADTRRIYTVGGWNPQYRMITWSVTPNGGSTNTVVIDMPVDLLNLSQHRAAFYIHTLTRNAFANRTVGGQSRQIGGGLAGYFYNEYDGSATGNADDSTAIIDADVITPRFHLGLPDVKKKVTYCAIEFDPIATESVTVQYQLDDNQSWTSFPESPFVMTGTDKKIARFTIPAPFEDISIRIRDNNTGEAYRALRVGFPKPIALTVGR